METLQVISVSTNQLVAQLVVLLPRFIVSLVIWYLGRYLLSVAGKLLRQMDIKETMIDDKAVETMAVIINAVGSVILVLIILDYLGIGSSVVSAIAQGITFAVSIALGIAFGKALEPEAKGIVEAFKDLFATSKSSKK